MDSELRRLNRGERSKTAHQYVLDTLRYAIRSGILPGSTRLVQAEIADQLGVSTTPVREAIRDLANEGLVDPNPRRGAVVREVGLEEVREIYWIRQSLESSAMRRAVERIAEAEIDRAATFTDRMAGTTDPGTWVELNRQFHAVFAEAAGAPRLASILTGLHDAAAAYVGLSINLRPGQITSGNADHRAIVEACRRRDADGAAAIVARHLAATMAAIEAEYELRRQGRPLVDRDSHA